MRSALLIGRAFPRRSCAPPRRAACPTTRRPSRRSRRGVASGPSPVSTMVLMRPGRALITTTRCDRNTASRTSWVTNTTVLRKRCHSSRSSSCMILRVCASSAPNGSSISRIDGSQASMRAMATRCCMPPDSWFGKVFSKPLSLTMSMKACAVRRRSRLADAALGQPVFHIAEHGLPGKQREVLEHDAAVRPRLADRRAAHADFAGRAGHEAADHVQQRALAAAARSDDGDEFAVADRQRDPIDGGQFAIVFQRIGLAYAVDFDERHCALFSPSRRLLLFGIVPQGCTRCQSEGAFRGQTGPLRFVAVGPDAVGDRIGDVLLGDHADDALAARQPAAALGDDGQGRAIAATCARPRRTRRRRRARW